MPESLEIYEKAVTTGRSAEKLAHRHGFKDVDELARFLPQDAQILDVGAGASPFGKTVAALRPDVTWTNFDYSYHNPTIFDDVTKDSPDNVNHVAGDATRLREIYEPDQFNAVFSYWLLPHLSINEPGPAKAAAEAMFTITKPGGLISVGPKSHRRLLPAMKSGPAIRVIKNKSLDSESYADRIVDQTTLPKTGRYTQTLANEVATSFFGTTRYAKRDGLILRVYDPKSDEYVLPFGPRGTITAGRLAIALARHASRR